MITKGSGELLMAFTEHRTEKKLCHTKIVRQPPVTRRRIKDENGKHFFFVTTSSYLHCHGPALLVEARGAVALLKDLLEGGLEQAVGHLVPVPAEDVG